MAGGTYNPNIGREPEPVPAAVAFDPAMRDRFLASKAEAPGAAEMSDLQFALAAHQKAYSDLPVIDYLTRLGFDRGDALFETRADDDQYGKYLRAALAMPGTGESTEDAEKRQGGALTVRRADTGEGAARAALQGSTFGFGDEIVAVGAAALDPLVHGDDGSSFGERFAARHGTEGDLIENFREDDPVTAYGAEVLGAIPTSVAVGGQFAGRGANVAQRLLSSGGVAAGQGAVYGAGAADGDVSDRAEGAATGAILGAGADLGLTAVAKTVQNLFRQHGAKQVRQQATAAAPKADDIKAQSQAEFGAADASGAQIKPQASSMLAHDYRTMLQSEGLILPNGKLPEGTGRIKRALAMLDQFTDAPMTMRQFQRFEELLQDVAASPKAGQARIGKMMLDTLDDFIEALPRQAYSGGNGPDAAANWLAGKADWARFKRTKTIEDAFYNARMTPGVDFATNLRSAIGKQLKDHRKRSRGFSDAEVVAMEVFVEGGPIGNMMQAFAKGGGIPSGVFGGMAGGPAGAVAGAGASLGSKLWVDKAARHGIDQIRAEVATPGGLPQRPGPQSLSDLESLVTHSGGSAMANPMLSDERDWLQQLLFSGGR